MRKWFYLFLLLFFLQEICIAQNNDFINGRIYIKLRQDNNIVINLNEKNISNRLNTIPFLKDISAKYNIKEIKQPFVNIENGKSEKDEHLQNIYEINFTDYNKADSIVNYLQSFDYIEYAEKAVRHKLLYEPNDPLYKSTAYQLNWNWWLDKINAQKAWDITKGTSSVLVGIADNAMWTSHPDLTGQLYRQFDLADNDNNPNPPQTNDNLEKYDWSHGTHIAGIIGATQDNNIGISGVAPKARMIFAKSSADTSDGMYMDYALYAMQWLANNGAKVINMSWGSNYESKTEEYIINNCYNKGIILIGAAGNDGKEILNYPAAYPNVISVASINDNNTRSSFSEYGSWVTLSAPGGFTPYDTPSGVSLLSTTYSSSYIVGQIFPGENYDIMQGTSMAAPVVSGICALMLSVNPSLTPLQAKTCLQTTAVNIDSYNTKYAGKIGSGYPDAYNAVKCAQQALLLKADFKANKTNITEGNTVNFTDYSTGSPTSWYWTFEGGTPSTSTAQNPTNIQYKKAGTYKVSLTVNKASTSNSKNVDNYIIVTSQKLKCDTLRYPQTPPYLVYYSKSGYYTGNNSLDFRIIAEFFPSTEYKELNELEGAAVKFAGAIGEDSRQITLSVWKDSNGKPTGNPVASKTLTIGKIKSDISSGKYTFFNFDNPYKLTGSFYIGVVLPNTAGDTLVIVSNTKGVISNPTAWVRTSSGWYSYKESFQDNLNIRLAISPLLCQLNTSIKNITNDNSIIAYPNPANNFINIESNEDINYIEIYNSIGIKIFSLQNINKKKFAVNTSEYSSGIYFINIHSGDKKAIRKIIIE